MTKFKLLVQTKASRTAGEGYWKEWKDIEAHSADSAIKKAYLSNQNVTDVLAVVAVPARSWKPTKVRIESTPRVILGGDEPSKDAA